MNITRARNTRFAVAAAVMLGTPISTTDAPSKWGNISMPQIISLIDVKIDSGLPSQTTREDRSLLSKQAKLMINDIEAKLANDQIYQPGDLFRYIKGGTITLDDLKELFKLAQTNNLTGEIIDDVHNLASLRKDGYLQLDLGSTILQKIGSNEFKILKNNFEKMSKVLVLGGITKKDYEYLLKNKLLESLTAEFQYESQEHLPVLNKFFTFSKLMEAAEYYLQQNNLNEPEFQAEYEKLLKLPPSEAEAFINSQLPIKREREKQATFQNYLANGLVSEQTQQDWITYNADKQEIFIDDIRRVLDAVKKGYLTQEDAIAFDRQTDEYKTELMSKVFEYECEDTMFAQAIYNKRITETEREQYVSKKMSDEQVTEFLSRANTVSDQQFEE